MVPAPLGKKVFPLPDFGIAGHFINRVVDVHCILDHCAVLKHLDLLGHASNGKVVTVSVKFNTETQGITQSFRSDYTDRKCFSVTACYKRRKNIIKPASSIQNI